MNDKMMVESIFTECQKVKRVWKESGEDGNCYGAFCALYGLIEKWDLTEVYKAWEETLEGKEYLHIETPQNTYYVALNQ